MTAIHAVLYHHTIGLDLTTSKHNVNKLYAKMLTCEFISQIELETYIKCDIVKSVDVWPI